MNADEMNLITDLTEQLKAMSTSKEPEADAAIQQHIAQIPEALYKLVQMVLIQHMAIDQLKAKISAAESKPVQTPPKGFLDDLKEKLFGSSTPQAVPSSNISQRPTETFSSPPPSALNQPAIGAGSSFLRQAMTVGAGVAGGMMLGNALGSLFQHGNSSSLNQPSEIVENNYYEDKNNSTADQSTTDDYQDDSSDQDSDDNSSFDDMSNDSDWA